MKDILYGNAKKITRCNITYNPAFSNQPLESFAILVNKEFALPPSYRPTDLVLPDVPFSCISFSEKKYYAKKLLLPWKNFLKRPCMKRNIFSVFQATVPMTGKIVFIKII